MESISRSPVPSKGLGFFNALPYPVVTQLVTLFTGPLNALLSVLPVHKELDRAAHRGLQRPLKAHTFRTGEAKWEEVTDHQSTKNTNRPSRQSTRLGLPVNALSGHLWEWQERKRNKRQSCPGLSVISTERWTGNCGHKAHL